MTCCVALQQDTVSVATEVALWPQVGGLSHATAALPQSQSTRSGPCGRASNQLVEKLVTLLVVGMCLETNTRDIMCCRANAVITVARYQAYADAQGTGCGSAVACLQTCKHGRQYPSCCHLGTVCILSTSSQQDLVLGLMLLCRLGISAEQRATGAVKCLPQLLLSAIDSNALSAIDSNETKSLGWQGGKAAEQNQRALPGIRQWRDGVSQFVEQDHEHIFGC